MEAKAINKTCGLCKKEFPRTEDYFFIKVIRQKLAGGEIAIYYSFRSDCKKCHGLKGKKRKHKHKSLEHNCTVEEYAQKAKLIGNIRRWEGKRKYHFLDDLPISNIKKEWIKQIIRQGYSFTTYEQLLADRKEYRKSVMDKKRKIPLPKGFYRLKDIPDKERKYLINRRLTEGRLANWLGFKVGELPKEVIETKRLIVELRRIINNNN
jgi:hypothetical protein